MARAAMGLLVVAVIAAWGLRGPSAAVGLPTDDPTAASGVALIDRAGVVETMRAVPGIPREGILPGERADQLLVGWLTGDCGPPTTLTVSGPREALVIEVLTEPCHGLGVGRTQAVMLDLDGTVDPGTVRLIVRN